MARSIKVELDLDTGNFSAKIRDATGKFHNLHTSIQNTGVALSTTEGRARRTLAVLRDLTVTAGQARNAFLNVRDAIGSWLGPIVSANSQIERASFLLQGMSQELTALGRQTEAAENLDWLMQTAKSAPFSLDALTNSFVKMKSGGLDPLDGSMKSLIDAVATFGGDSQILNRASIAIQQMSGKGVISMEELRQQLGEAVPTAITLMARSLGVSYQELVERIAKGQVLASGALKRMFGEFERTFGGASSRLVESFGGAVQRAQTTLMEFALSIGGFQNGAFQEGSFMRTLTDAVNEFSDALGSGEAQQFARDVGEVLSSVTAVLRDMVRWLVQNVDLVVGLGKAFLIAFAGRLIFNGMTALIGGLGGIGREVNNLSRHLRNMQRNFGLAVGEINRANRAGGLSAISFERMGRAATGFGRALLGAIPIVGQAIFAITAIAEVFGLFRDRAKEAREAFEDFKNGIVTQDGLEKTRDEIDRVQARLAELQAIKDNDKPYWVWGVWPVKGEGLSKGLAEEFDTLTTELADKKAEWQRAVNLFSSEKGSANGRNIIRNFELQRAELNSAYDRAAREFAARRDAINADETKGEEQKTFELSRIRAEELANVKNYYDTLIANAEKEVKFQEEHANAMMALDAKAEPNDRGIRMAEQNRKGYAAQLQVLNEWLQAQREARDSQIAMLSEPLPFVEGKDDDKDKVSAAERKIIQLEGNVAKLKGGFNKAQAAVDEFNAEVAEGGYPEITAAQKKRIESLLMEEATIENTADAQEHLNDVLDEANRAQEDYRVTMDALWNGGVERNASQVENFRQRLVGMTNAMLEATGPTDEWVQAVMAIDGAVSNFAGTRVASYLDSIRTAMEEMSKAQMSTSELREFEYQKEVERAKRLLDLNTLTNEDRKKAEELVYGYFENLRRKEEFEILGSIRRQFNGWRDLNQNIADGISGWVDQMIDSLVQGEFSFGKFAKAVLADIAKIIIRATIANAIISAMGGMGGGPKQLSQADMDASISTPIFHSGGTVGLNSTSKKVFSGLFNSAMRYHTGGIAGLKPDEVPAILQKGERVSTEQQWKQLNSRSSGGEVQVNLINQSGQPLQAGGASTRFDGKQMILDVVIEAMNKPGKMRETVKSVK